MGWLTDLLRADGPTRDPVDERWWTTGPGGTAQSGVWVGAETALMASPVWACVSLISESIATLPIIMYRRLGDGGKKRAPGHPLYDLLHDAPNDIQTAFVFKRVLMVHALLYGGGYAKIVSGARGSVDALEPIHPDMIRAEQLPGGGVRYMVRGDDGMERPENAEDIFHLPGLSLDGVNGLSLIQYARDSVGLNLAAMGYSARFYSQGASPGGVLETPKVLSNERAEKLRARWKAAHSGLRNAHQVAVLEEGVSWKGTGMTHEAAQLIQQLDFSAADLARYFKVPLHMIQAMTKSTSWGSGIEEMGIEFVTYCLLPWIENWEQLISAKLILAPQRYFAEFLLDALMRGKLLDRYQAYHIARTDGWMNPDEIRAKENMNPLPNGQGQAYLRPLNMEEVGAENRGGAEGGADVEGLAPRSAVAGSGGNGRVEKPGLRTGHYFMLLYEAASRVIRKEISAMSRAAKKCAGDPQAWFKAVCAFYQQGHARFVMETLGIDKSDAERYVLEQIQALSERGAGVMEDWETRRVGDLVALAMVSEYDWKRRPVGVVDEADAVDGARGGPGDG